MVVPPEEQESQWRLVYPGTLGFAGMAKVRCASYLEVSGNNDALLVVGPA